MSNKQIQLFILPYAGGSIAAFKKLSELLDSRIDVITVEYPGRGTRAKEALSSNIWSLLDDAIKYCQHRRERSIPYAIMGYSMGSILAYEMISRNALIGYPKHFFVSAEISPKERSIELSKMGCLKKDQILERAKKLGGLDNRLLKNKRFADIYIKPMLSDYNLFFDYRFRGFIKQITVNTTFFYCEKDTPLAEICKWGELIDGEFSFYNYGENHFFINQHYAEIAKVINNTLLIE